MSLGGRLIKNKEKRKQVVHIFSGVVILVHAYEKWESGHHSYVYFTIAGWVFLTIALLHPLIERRAPWVDGVFFVIEGILSLIVAADFFRMGKKALPLCYLLIAVFQFVVAFVRSKKGIAHHHAAVNAQREKQPVNP